MVVYHIDGTQLQEVLAAGATRLARLRKDIDALNVFPVPDGDTGTNMYLTFIAALNEIGTVKEDTISAAAEAAARGALSGARGNSGVILSQVFYGFANSLSGKTKATAQDIAEALAEGASMAYRAVGQPVEGTILTVARRSADAALYAAQRSYDIRRVILYAYREGVHALEETPELLPVLKEAGVVDAGGKGFLVILDGILQTFRNRDSEDEHPCKPDMFEEPQTVVPAAEYSGDIEFGYCTEFLVKGTALNPEGLRSDLTGLGDCLMVVGTPNTLKVHVHTNHPGVALEKALRHGALVNIHINNMRDQHARIQHENKPVAVIGVALGEGLVTIMESMGADAVVNGGQTMNPSTEEIARAAENAPSENVIILPNNKNVILAAQQAGQVSKKNVHVVPTTSVPQGFAALLALDSEASLQDNIHRMTEAAASVKSGEVTRAVRDARMNGLHVKAGDFLGIAEGRMVKGETLTNAVLRVIDSLRSDADLVTLYYGADVTEAQAELMIEVLRKKLPGIEFELYYGGQPLYHFIISVE